MSLQARLDALKERHAILDDQIADEERRPRPNEDHLSQLKLEKLRLKEEIERLKTELAHA